jgi:lysophospholipase L1-like esterase
MKKKVVCVFGSSVALGSGISGSWAKLLADALSESCDVVNASQSGSDTRCAISRINVVQKLKPDFVVLSLSLPNEDLNVSSFHSGITRLLKLMSETMPSTRVILCGCYPFNMCADHPRIRALFEQTVAMLKSAATEHKAAFVDFFSSVHDGNGAWPKGAFEDDVHPNHLGHKLMFDAIDLRLFQE